MKKILPLLAIGILVLSGLGAVAYQTSNIIIEEFSYNFSQPIITEQNLFSTIDFRESNSYLTNINQPYLPSYTRTYTYPMGTEIVRINCQPKNIQEISLSMPIQPVSEPKSVGSKMFITEDIPNSYSMKQYPDTWYNYDVGCGIVNNEHRIIVKVEVFPIQYFPDESYVNWAKNIDTIIEYVLPLEPVIFRDAYDFIILGPSEYSDELASLVTHKNSRGIDTLFVSLDDIYTGTYFTVTGRDNQEKIKYFIKDAMENWNIKNVLLVGSASKFPYRYTHVYIDNDPPEPEEFPSDLYYADIYYQTGGFCDWDSNGNSVFGEYNWEGNTDDVDLYPDVYLGRLACTSGNQVTICVNKIKTYENNEAYTSSWFSDLITVGGDTWPDDSGGVTEGEVNCQTIIDIMEYFIPNRLWASEGDLGVGVTLPYGVQVISSAINQGAGFLFFTGHGNRQLYSTHPYQSHSWLPTPLGYYANTPHVSGLSNGNKLPIIVTSACSCSKFSADSNCFDWAFMAKSNGGGIAVLGASGLGYSSQGNPGHLIDEIAEKSFEAYMDQTILTFGEMWATALDDYIGPSMDKYDHKTVEEWEPFGDPTLAIRSDSQPPYEPAAPSGTSNGKAGVTYTYTTSTTDPESDQIYYKFDWDDGTTSDWEGPFSSGNTGSADHQWSEQGDYQIKVIAKDENGVFSPWSDPLSITMPLSHSHMHNFPLLEYVLTWFPNAFPLLRMLIGY